MVKTTNRYYALCGKNTKEGTVSESPCDYSQWCEYKKEIIENRPKDIPFEFTVHSYVITDKLYLGDVTDEAPLDFEANDSGISLMSEKLQQIISSELLGTEKLHWIKARLNGLTKSYTYYIPLFTEDLDVLNTEHTTYVPNTDHIINPAYKKEEIEKYAVFYKPGYSWQLFLSFNVNEAIKKKIEKTGITGVCFERIKRIF